MTAAPVIIDGKGHLLGRLASVVAKQALSGQKVVVVRSELINVSGSFFRNKLKYHAYLHKTHCYNPSKGGPWHERAPSRILHKAIRGMIPHKTARGKAALAKITLVEGMPSPYDAKKKVVVPAALRVLRLKPGRKYATLKRVSSEFGWKYEGVVSKLEEKRQVRSVAYQERKLAAQKKKQAALSGATGALAEVNQKLAVYGF